MAMGSLFCMHPNQMKRIHVTMKRPCTLLVLAAVTVLTAHGYAPILSQGVRGQSILSASVANKGSDAFITKSFFASSECDDINTPPSLSILLRSLDQLPSGSDIRGRFVDHSRVGSISNVAHAIGASPSGIPPLTPIAAHCLGHAFARMLQETFPEKESFVVALGKDPRPHGSRLCDAFARGVESVQGVQVCYTGLATTPAMFEFCRSKKCDGAVMVTASHLPVDRNGLKFFTNQGGFDKKDLVKLVEYAKEQAQHWHDQGILPPTSGKDAVFCSEWVNHMPHYASTLKNAILNQVGVSSHKPLEGLKIVLNAGNGSGGFFNDVLKDLGADVKDSIWLEPDGEFPAGYVPNPESSTMIEETTRVCEMVNADIGILLDTDADRCGFVVPRVVNEDGTRSDYEALNRNRLIALLSVIFSETSPGCAIVTDSVTSEGLETFLQQDLGLQHVRYLKGYANVINKARELTESGAANAEMAIETSGHCAMKENDYLDDGTYTACKIVGLLARISKENKSLLDLISNLTEMPEEGELRMELLDESLESTSEVFDFAALEIEQLCESVGSEEDPAIASWKIDTENLEGVRVRTGNGGFFMLRKSLHDPVISLQVEGTSRDEIRATIIDPLLKLFDSESRIGNALNLNALQAY